jgi:hypothetical protein
MDTHIIIGLLGVLFHSLLKMSSLAKDSRLANIPFHPVQDYLIKDLFGILASFASVFIWYFLFDEVAAKYPAIEGFTKVSFFVMGAMGSYILQMVLSQAKKKIRNVVDQKTDKADGITKTPGDEI